MFLKYDNMDYRLYYWLIFSLSLHAVFLFLFSTVKLKKQPNALKQIEVTYQNIKAKTAQIKPPAPAANLNVAKSEPKSTQKIDILSRKGDDFIKMDKTMNEVSKFSGPMELNDKQLPRMDSLDSGRKIDIPVFQSEKITNPKYLSYNETIRQKIRQRAYAYVDHPDFKAGEVYLTFVLGADGVLKQIKIIEDKTHANNYLRSIGQRSIQESSPFSPFPKDLSYPELTFNVVISFEVE